MDNQYFENQESNNPRNFKLAQKQTELNRMGALGSALTQELEEQIAAGTITPEIAREIVKHFDFAYAEQLNVLEQQPSKIEATLEAHLDMYRFFDDTADLELSNVKIQYTKPDQTRVKLTDKVFIKALDPDQVQ